MPLERCAPYSFAYISPVKEVELSFLVDVLDYILLSPHFSGSSRDRKTFEVEVESRVRSVRRSCKSRHVLIYDISYSLANQNKTLLLFIIFALIAIKMKVEGFLLILRSNVVCGFSLPLHL